MKIFVLILISFGFVYAEYYDKSKGKIGEIEVYNSVFMNNDLTYVDNNLNYSNSA